MQVRRLAIQGAIEITPRQHRDDRGSFLEWYRADQFFESVGHAFDLRQANCSISAAGVLRGIHYADVPPGQAKYVTCVQGAVVDVVVDVRIGSPTFGTWESVLLDDVDRRAIYIGQGLGHAFMSLADCSTVVYLCSTPHMPSHERGVHPLDPAIGIVWPTQGRGGRYLEPILSEKDAAAPTLADATATGVLPDLDTVNTYLGTLS